MAGNGTEPIRVLVVDAYDSFVHTIADYLRQLGADARVVRHDEVTAQAVLRDAPDLLLLGPGPGRPEASGHLGLIEGCAGRLPIFGVCLGHQAVALAFGGRITRGVPVHGKIGAIDHDGSGCFRDLANPLTVVRYNSLMAEEATLPADLTVTARAGSDGQIMALRHRDLPIESVQFHPESIGGEAGLALFANLLAALG